MNKEEIIEPEIVYFANQVLSTFSDRNLHAMQYFMQQLFESVTECPEQLKRISNFESLGKAFTFMISRKLTDDFQDLQTIVSLGYFCITKAIQKNQEDIELYKDRVLLLEIGHESFRYTVRSAFNLNNVGITSYLYQQVPLKARDAIYKMQIADLELNPELYQFIDFFNKIRNDFIRMIDEEFFLPQRTKDEVINKGIENHKILFNYLENKIMNNENL